jgi:hypothetical protein
VSELLALLLYELLFEVFSEAFVALLLADRPFVCRHIIIPGRWPRIPHFPHFFILYTHTVDDKSSVSNSHLTLPSQRLRTWIPKSRSQVEAVIETRRVVDRGWRADLYPEVIPFDILNG